MDGEALDALERAVAATPHDVALRLHLARCLLADGQAAAALGHCERVLRTEPERSEALDVATQAREQLVPGDGQGSAPAFSTPGSGARPLAAHDASAAPEEDEVDLSSFRPALTLDDVCGMDEVKERLRRSFIEPMRHEELRRAFGQSLRAGLLLWGPPGCGKTFIAKALAGELGLWFVHVGISDVLDMWLGNSERQLHELFEEARRMAPAMLFIDELDALGHRRTGLGASAGRNIVNQLLLELDGAGADNEGLLVLGATNQPWDVDVALMRPGRFDRQMLVLPPDVEARRGILAYHLQRPPTGELDLHRVADLTDGYSSADVAAVCREATELAMQASMSSGRTEPVTQERLERAVASVRPSISAWLQTGLDYATFAREDDTLYEELRGYLKKHPR